MASYKEEENEKEEGRMGWGGKTENPIVLVKPIARKTDKKYKNREEIKLT